MIGSKCCVLVADGTRARFLTLEPAQFSQPKSGPQQLVEKKNLINPNLDMRGRDLWSDPKTGRGRAAGGGPSHGYDDHREQHEDEFERRFAKQIAENTALFLHACRDEQLVIAAQKRMLGFLRPELKRCLKEQVQVRELAKDVTKLNPTQLYNHLADRNLLPRRRQPQPGVVLDLRPVAGVREASMSRPGRAKSTTQSKTKKHNPIAKSAKPSPKSKSRAPTLKSIRTQLRPTIEP